MIAYQVLAILRAAQPTVRAIEALATTVPLFLLLFSATYFLMSRTSTSDFNVHALSRTDSLYFTVTVFATVGFGDISPASQMARLVVTAQMILDLIVLGLGVRLYCRRGPAGTPRQPGRQKPSQTLTSIFCTPNRAGGDAVT